MRDEGIVELRQAIDRFVSSAANGALARRRRERAESRLRAVLADRLVREALERSPAGERFATIVDEIAERRTDPYTGVDRLVAGSGPRAQETP